MSLGLGWSAIPWLENDAAGRARLLRLELAQDSAFVAAALPVGIGLPRQRGALP